MATTPVELAGLIERGLASGEMSESRNFFLTPRGGDVWLADALGFAIVAKFGDPAVAYERLQRAIDDSAHAADAIGAIASVLDAPIELVRAIDLDHGNGTTARRIAQKLRTWEPAAR
jgi:hypothetical protein